MTDEVSEERDENPAVEVRVYRHGELIHRQLCESEDEAAGVVDHWADVEGVVCEVDDLSVHHHLEDILEGTGAPEGDDGYDRVEPPEPRRYE